MKTAEIRREVVKRMDSKGISAYKLARSMPGRVAPETVERWLSGKRGDGIRIGTLESILEALGLELTVRIRRRT